MTVSQKCRTTSSSSAETSDSDDESDVSNSSDDDGDVTVAVDECPPTVDLTNRQSADCLLYTSDAADE